MSSFSRDPKRERARRASLYMPGDSLRKIQKAAGLGVDCIIMDLEDGVGLSQKEAARTTIVEALTSLDFGRAERMVRTNAIRSGRATRDVLDTIAGKPDGYVIPKVESADELHFVDRLLSDLEGEHGIAAGSLTLQAIIETSRGLFNVAAIAAASPRLTVLQFGAEDLTGDLGATRTPEGREVAYGQSVVLITANAHGLQALDGVFLAWDDPDACYADSLRSAQLGFDGRMAIHPNQLEPIYRAYTPTDEAIAAAQRIVDEAARYQAEGIGAFALDGKMVDQPIVNAALAVLAKARAANG